MKALKTAVMVASLGFAMASAMPATAQTVGYNIRTGDVWVDTRLGEINDYGRRYRDPFVSEMTGYYGAPRSLVLELLDRRGWAPADVYFACAIARALGIPCLDVVHRYDRNPGIGWGNLAKQMGIKPGSREFHALKNGAVGTYDRWGYPIRVDQRVSVDWSKHGPSHGKGGNNGKPAQGPAKQDHSSHGQGNSGKGPGNSNKGNNGKGNGKGNGRD
ncbi:MAG TPA: hypothetical protein VGE60_04755 [Telluria sp.]